MTPAGIEPATSRFVAQHLNHCATAVPTDFGNFVFYSIQFSTLQCPHSNCKVKWLPMTLQLVIQIWTQGCQDVQTLSPHKIKWRAKRMSSKIKYPTDTWRRILQYQCKNTGSQQIKKAECLSMLGTQIYNSPLVQPSLLEMSQPKDPPLVYLWRPQLLPGSTHLRPENISHISLYVTHITVRHTYHCTSHISLYVTHITVRHTYHCMSHISLYVTHITVCHTYHYVMFM